MTVVAARAIEKGAPVTISYGPLASKVVPTTPFMGRTCIDGSMSCTQLIVRKNHHRNLQIEADVDVCGMKDACFVIWVQPGNGGLSGNVGSRKRAWL